MIFQRTHRQKDSDTDNLIIVSTNGKKGIFNCFSGKYLVRAEYDRIFFHCDDIWILQKQGKIGAIQTAGEHFRFLAECKYDMLNTVGSDLIFRNGEIVRYWNTSQNRGMDFLELVWEPPFFYGKDHKKQYILSAESGLVIYQTAYTSGHEACFCFLGNTMKGPIFYDARYSTYLYPGEDGYRAYPDLFYHAVIVNGWNTGNLTEGEGGLGFMDSYGNPILSNYYDVIRIELKLTAVNKEEKVEKIISIPKNSFEKRFSK